MKDGVYDEEMREMLRASVKGTLERYWRKPTQQDSMSYPEEVSGIWRRLCEVGVGELGLSPSGGGLREALIVLNELGYASCPAPVLPAYLIHVAASEHMPFGEHLAAMAAGTEIPALGSARLGRETGSGGVRLNEGKLSGEVAFVDAAAEASFFVILTAGQTGLLYLRNEPSCVEIVPTRAMGINGLFSILMREAPAVFVPVGAEVAEALELLVQLGFAARALGAAQRSFSLAVEWAKERWQFGQPIGKFQAIQHKLANARIALDGVELTLANAADTKDRDDPNWRFFAAAAYATAAETLRGVVLESHHVLGAIGYAEEHEAPRHFKRVHLDLLRLGGARQAQEYLAHYLLDHGPRSLPQYDLGPNGNAFRVELRSWLDANWSTDRREAHGKKPFRQREFDASFARDLGRTGWIALGWPAEYGGQARGAMEQLAFIEEMERADAPRIGAPVHATAIMGFGTEAQKRELLPKIMQGEFMGAICYSEPGSGSDLASIRTKATRDGDVWVIEGEKVWTTTYWGQYIILAAKTDTAAKPARAGISVFLFPADLPGITIRPSTTMYDGGFANVLFDRVRVPADCLLGSVNGGWDVILGGLATERGFIGGGIIAKVSTLFDLLCEYIRGAEGPDGAMRLDTVVRQQVGHLAAEIEIGRQFMLRSATASADPSAMAIAAMSKVYSGELAERLCESALSLLGMPAVLSHGSYGAILDGRIEQTMRHSLMWVISMGTNEIQRTLIATLALGLPR